MEWNHLIRYVGLNHFIFYTDLNLNMSKKYDMSEVRFKLTVVNGMESLDQIFRIKSFHILY